MIREAEVRGCWEEEGTNWLIKQLSFLVYVLLAFVKCDWQLLMDMLPTCPSSVHHCVCFYTAWTHVWARMCRFCAFARLHAHALPHIGVCVHTRACFCRVIVHCVAHSCTLMMVCGEINHQLSCVAGDCAFFQEEEMKETKEVRIRQECWLANPLQDRLKSDFLHYLLLYIWHMADSFS